MSEEYRFIVEERPIKGTSVAMCRCGTLEIAQEYAKYYANTFDERFLVRHGSKVHGWMQRVSHGNRYAEWFPT